MVWYYYSLIQIGTLSVIYIIRKIRELQWGWVRNKSSLKDKVFIITGANAGLGFATTKALIARGATVILSCRSLEKANEAIMNIRRKVGGGKMIALELDLASFDSIHKFCKEIKLNYPTFVCLINNAGLALKTQAFTKENFEIHFGVNHLGHFLLTNLLEENIKENKSRIVIVSSKMHEHGNIDLNNLGKYYEDLTQQSVNNQYYNNSKLANFYFARELYKKGFDCHVLCPGLCHTELFRNYEPRWYHYILFSPVIWLMLRSAEQGAQNIIYCATDNCNTTEKNPANGYYIRSLKQTKSKYNFNDDISEKLWIESSKLCSLK